MSDELRPGKSGEIVVLRDAHTGLEQKYQYMTPEYCLTLNHEQNIRDLNEYKTKRFTKQQLEGNFFPDISTPVCYKGLAGGRIVTDGQNRTTAITKSGKPFWMRIQENVTPTSARHAVIDTGQSRTIDQNLGIPTKHGSCLNSILKYGLGVDHTANVVAMTGDERTVVYEKFVTPFIFLSSETGKGKLDTDLMGVASRIIIYQPALKELVRRAVAEIRTKKSQTGLTINQHDWCNTMRDLTGPGKSNSEVAKREKVRKLERAFLWFLQDRPLTRLYENTQEIW